MGIKDLEKHCALYTKECEHCSHLKECSKLRMKLSSFSPNKLAEVIENNEDITNIVLDNDSQLV